MADKLTYYEILGVSKESSLKEIAKAYRKKALKCHPDKNPDNPQALELFHELSKALEVLSDPKAKAAYDAVLKAKEQARLRTQALDAKRKKFKQDLEAREDAAKTEKESDEIAAKNLEAEINRLREEGSKLLKEQQELLRDQLKKEVECDKDSKIYQDVTPKLKVRWKSKKSDLTNGGYTQEMIRSLFEKYGEVSYVIVSSNKKGSAVAEFTSMASAKLAVENEHGIPDNPLQISWLDGEPSSNDASSETDPGVSKSTRDVGEATDKYMVRVDLSLWKLSFRFLRNFISQMATYQKEITKV
ncbi:dnaJ homolog subfamily C member 17 isoform X2 [Pocillopora verrucosa]|uniref:dnaJ homolog subfamily C member 17 isoform X2 n=1 Tax=Pocillopora verrucosa TaxID=203993 RepID=UPI00333E8BB0